MDNFRNVLKTFNFQIFDITLEVAEKAAELRAKYNFLRTVDALQIACAKIAGCKRFITNDLKLDRITEIEIVLIKNL